MASPTLATLLGKFYRELTILDSRIWQTLIGLTRPGRMALDWAGGRDNGVLPPVRRNLIARSTFALERALMRTRLVDGLEVFLERRWLLAIPAGVLFAFFVSLFLPFASGVAAGAMEGLIVT